MKLSKLSSVLAVISMAVLVLVAVQVVYAQSPASTAPAGAGIVLPTGTATTPATSTTSANPVVNTTAADTSLTPGLPNTGAGGAAVINFIIMLAAGLLVIGGTVVALREFSK